MPHLCSNGLLFVFHVEEIVLEPAVVIHRVDDCWLLARRLVCRGLVHLHLASRRAGLPQLNVFLGLIGATVGFICAWRG